MGRGGAPARTLADAWRDYRGRRRGASGRLRRPRALARIRGCVGPQRRRCDRLVPAASESSDQALIVSLGLDAPGFGVWLVGHERRPTRIRRNPRAEAVVPLRRPSRQAVARCGTLPQGHRPRRPRSPAPSRRRGRDQRAAPGLSSTMPPRPTSSGYVGRSAVHITGSTADWTAAVAFANLSSQVEALSAPSCDNPYCGSEAGKPTQLGRVLGPACRG